MLDIYKLSIKSALVTEITFISYLTSTKYYGILTGLFYCKVEIPTKLEALNRIYKSSTTDENSSKGISKVTE
jgi:hypothetical protein